MLSSLIFYMNNPKTAISTKLKLTLMKLEEPESGMAV